MKIFLVGGAVRDRLLGLPVHERDYVVVGGTVESMLSAGFLPVGKDFPVFLHPKTKENTRSPEPNVKPPQDTRVLFFIVILR